MRTRICEVWIDPHDPGVTCGDPAAARVQQPHRPEYHACAEHAREARRDGLDVVSLEDDDVPWSDEMVSPQATRQTESAKGK